METTKNKLSKMERSVRESLNGNVVWVEYDKIDLSIFQEVYKDERQGIGVYYPIYRDGSCAEPQYVRFYISSNGMSMETGTREEYEFRRAERLLRR